MKLNSASGAAFAAALMPPNIKLKRTHKNNKPIYVWILMTKCNCLLVTAIGNCVGHTCIYSQNALSVVLLKLITLTDCQLWYPNSKAKDCCDKHDTCKKNRNFLTTVCIVCRYCSTVLQFVYILPTTSSTILLTFEYSVTTPIVGITTPSVLSSLSRLLTCCKKLHTSVH